MLRTTTRMHPSYEEETVPFPWLNSRTIPKLSAAKLPRLMCQCIRLGTLE